MSLVSSESNVIAGLQSLPANRLVVAFSGGLDSTVLLSLAAKTTHEVIGLHIHHGLQDEAGNWAEHCRNFCAEQDIHCEVVEVAVPADGSIENNARTARYDAFEDFLEPADVLLMAHHQDDQVETALFNLLRGSDVPGVHGMPESRALGTGQLHRPLLSFSRQELEEYANSNGLRWIEDPSNQDVSIDRNFLRHELLPLIEARFPSARKAVTNAVSRDAEVAQVIENIAEMDLQACSVGSKRIRVDVFTKLPTARRLTLLRHWIAREGFSQAGGQALRAFAADFSDSSRLDWAGQSLRCHQQTICLVPPLPALTRTSGCLTLPSQAGIGGGTLTASPAGEGGIIMMSSEAEWRVREGGDQLLLDHHRAIKDLMREAGIPAWLRHRVPVLVRDGLPIAIPALPGWGTAQIVAHSARAERDDAGWMFSFDAGDGA